MPGFPGQLTPEEQGAWQERFRLMAVERWGERRASAISDALDEVALATGALLKLEFANDEAPGFYLPVHFDESAGDWKTG